MDNPLGFTFVTFFLVFLFNNKFNLLVWRYPSLHAFVFNELKVATVLLGDGSSGHSESDLANVVHPSLWLLLTLILSCSRHSSAGVQLRALTGLESNENLAIVLHNGALPCIENQLSVSPVSSTPLHMTQGSHLGSGSVSV